MADFGGMVLTTKGLNLLAKAQTGTKLVITRVAAGAGVWADGTNAEDVTALVDERLSVPIQSMSVQGDGTVKLTVVISNSGLAAGFIFRELGVFAQDPDLGEILYAVAYSGDRYDFLPASATVVEKILDIYIVVGGAQNVTATISPGAVIALKDDLTAHEEADPAHPASKISFDNTSAQLSGAPIRVQAAIEALAASTFVQIVTGNQAANFTTTSSTPVDTGLTLSITKHKQANKLLLFIFGHGNAIAKSSGSQANLTVQPYALINSVWSAIGHMLSVRALVACTGLSDVEITGTFCSVCSLDSGQLTDQIKLRAYITAESYNGIVFNGSTILAMEYGS